MTKKLILGSAVSAWHLYEGTAALCLDCRAIFEMRLQACPACASTAFVPLTRFTERVQPPGRLPAYAMATPQMIEKTGAAAAQRTRRFFAVAMIDAESLRDACGALEHEMKRRQADLDERFERGLGETPTLEETLESMADAGRVQGVVAGGLRLRVDITYCEDNAYAAAALRSWARQIEEGA